MARDGRGDFDTFGHSSHCNMLIVTTAVVVLLQCVSAQRVFSLSCPTGYFGPQCLPIDTSSNKECGDWRAKGWTRGDVQQSLWTERNIDGWLSKFIQKNPSLTTSSLSRAPYGFYKELAQLTGHSWDSTCNMHYPSKAFLTSGILSVGFQQVYPTGVLRRII